MARGAGKAERSATGGLRSPGWRYNRRAAIGIGFIVIALLVYARAENSSFLTSIRTNLFDFYTSNIVAERSGARDVVVVDIDDESIRRIGQWPWPRFFMAKLLNAATTAGASAVAFDVIFAEADRLSPVALSRYIALYNGSVAASVKKLPDTDQLFARSILRTPTVLSMSTAPFDIGEREPPPGRFLVRGDSAEILLPEHLGLIRSLGVLEEAASGAGVTDLQADSDGVTRRIPLAFRVGATLYPSMALEAVRVYRRDRLMVVNPSAQGGIQSISVGDLTLPTDALGRVWAYFGEFDIPTITAHDLLSGKAAPGALQGKLVVIGVSASGTAPAWNVGGGALAPGHHVHAAAASAMLNGAISYRPYYFTALEILATVVIALVILGLLAFERTRLAIVLLISAPVIATLVSALRFAQDRVLIDPTFMVLMLLALALYWAFHQLMAQRVALLQERSSVGRVVSLMSEGMIITDRDGVVISSNPAADRMLGDEKDAAVSQSLTAEPEDSQLRRLVQREAADDAGDAMILEIDSAWHADGAERFGVHMIRDISKLTQAEHAAARASERLASAAGNMADGVVLVDLFGRISFYNPAIKRMLPDRPDLELYGRPYETFMADVFGKGAAGRLLERRPTQSPDVKRRDENAGAVEYELQTQAGVWLLVRERGTPEGGLVGVFTDITMLKMVESELREARLRAEDAMQAKDRFLATVSHELRTPLNAIIGFSDTIRHELFGPLGSDKYKEYVGDILASGGELLDLVENLLDAASVETADFRIELHPMSVNAFARSLVHSFGPQSRQADIAIELRVDDAMPSCNLDERAMRRVLSNLITNSLKYTEPGGKIVVVANYLEHIGHVLVVSDTGIGMSPAQLKRVFEPFWQGSAPAAALSDGIGLGLPLVKALVERQGGRIDVESAIGQGTIVKITFPPRDLLEELDERDGQAAAPRPVADFDYSFSGEQAVANDGDGVEWTEPRAGSY